MSKITIDTEKEIDFQRLALDLSKKTDTWAICGACKVSLPTAIRILKGKGDTNPSIKTAIGLLDLASANKIAVHYL